MNSKVILPSRGCFSSADNTVESVREEFNIYQTSFGRDDANEFWKSSYEHCKNEKRAKLEKETFEMQIQYC